MSYRNIMDKKLMI